MTTFRRVPSGRAGRLWLIHRIGVAEHGADQLERKVQIVSAELARRRVVAERSRQEWDTRCRDAELWTLRAATICGDDGVRHACPPQPARAELMSTSTVGVRHPTSAVMCFPDAVDTILGSAALVRARSGAVDALRAGVESAVADAAVAALEEALVATRRRARILRHHWLPRLHNQLRELELALEQSEQEDHARFRRIIS